MKKTLFPFLLVAMLFMFSACGDERTTAPTDIGKEQASAPVPEVEETEYDLEPKPEPELEPTPEPEPTPQPEAPSAPAQNLPQPEKKEKPAPAQALLTFGEDAEHIEFYPAGVSMIDYELPTESIPDFCSFLGLEHYQSAQPIKTLSGISMVDGPFIRLTTSNMETLCIYQYQLQAVYRSKDGKETYYNVPENAFETVCAAAASYGGKSSNTGNFDKTFRRVSVQKGYDGTPVALSKSDTMRLMASMPLWQCQKAEKAETLSTKDNSSGDFFLITNEDNQRIAIFKDKGQFKYISPDDKVSYYNIGNNSELQFDGDHGKIDRRPASVLYSDLLAMVNSIS